MDFTYANKDYRRLRVLVLTLLWVWWHHLWFSLSRGTTCTSKSSWWYAHNTYIHTIPQCSCLSYMFQREKSLCQQIRNSRDHWWHVFTNWLLYTGIEWDSCPATQTARQHAIYPRSLHHREDSNQKWIQYGKPISFLTGGNVIESGQLIITSHIYLFSLLSPFAQQCIVSYDGWKHLLFSVTARLI